jgi:hypothetical protein
MYRWLLVALGGMTLSGLTLAVLRLDGPQPEPVKVQEQREGPANLAEAINAARALNLHWVSDPPGRSDNNAVIVSDQPVTLERHANLFIGHPDFERWRGTVKVYVGGQEFFEMNINPAHPERYALWGEVCLYGDPELIAKLLASSR